MVTHVDDNVRNARVAVRPAPTKFVAPKSVRPPKLSRRCAQHFPSQRAAVQMLPQTFPRQFFGNDCAWPGGAGAKAIAIYHIVEIDFTELPFLDLATNTN